MDNLKYIQRIYVNEKILVFTIYFGRKMGFFKKMYYDYWHGSDSDNDNTQRMPVARSSRNDNQVSSSKKGKRKLNEERIKSQKLKSMKGVKIKKLNSTNGVETISPKQRHEQRIKIKKLKANKATNLGIKSKIKAQPAFEPDEEKDQKFEKKIEQGPKQLHRSICKEIGKNPDDPKYAMVRQFKGEIYKVARGPIVARYGGICGLPNCGNEFVIDESLIIGKHSFKKIEPIVWINNFPRF